MSETATPSIPKVIHRIWLGGEMPGDAAALGHRWRALHPGWTIRTWRDWDLPALRHQQRFDRAGSPAGRADIARLEILHRHGGVYVDTDVEPLRSFDELLDDGTTCFLSYEDERWIGTAVVASTPGHPFLGLLLDELGESIDQQPGQPPNEQSGPKFVTRVHAEAPAALRAQVVIHPSSHFYPYHFSEPERRHGPFPDAFAVHHWSATWTAPAAGSSPRALTTAALSPILDEPHETS